MGDPKKQKKRYETPRHPWKKDRIELEKGLIVEYGLKNHKEVWKARSFVKRATDQAKKLIGEKTEKKDVEKKNLIRRLQKYGLIQADAGLDKVFDIQPKDVLERRLQTIAVRKGLCKSMKQARQMIVHGHITVGGKKQTSPSYLVMTSEENSIAFSPASPFSDENHPEIIKIIESKEPKQIVKEESGEKE
ncbi:MAG: small subunit ribosomal protein [Candidatus Woesearchaeota archaeon]|nr:small subunit ribosomal protein [Candidatus Woesearchaeota archaeon]